MTIYLCSLIAQIYKWSVVHHHRMLAHLPFHIQHNVRHSTRALNYQTEKYVPKIKNRCAYAVPVATISESQFIKFLRVKVSEMASSIVGGDGGRRHNFVIVLPTSISAMPKSLAFFYSFFFSFVDVGLVVGILTIFFTCDERVCVFWSDDRVDEIQFKSTLNFIHTQNAHVVAYINYFWRTQFFLLVLLLSLCLDLDYFAYESNENCCTSVCARVCVCGRSFTTLHFIFDRICDNVPSIRQQRRLQGYGMRVCVPDHTDSLDNIYLFTFSEDEYEYEPKKKNENNRICGVNTRKFEFWVRADKIKNKKNRNGTNKRDTHTSHNKAIYLFIIQFWCVQWRSVRFSPLFSCLICIFSSIQWRIFSRDA